MSNKVGNLHINGSGSYPGGTFEKISISGSGNINGDIKCKKISISGSASIKGNVDCGKFVGAGTSTVHGDLICEEMSISGTGKVTGNVKTSGVISLGGTFKVEGNIEALDLHIAGAGKILGSIKCNSAKIGGVLKVMQNIEAEEEVRVEGILNNEGLISAERVIIDVIGWGSVSSFNEIGATHVSINNRMGSEGILGRVMGIFSGRGGKTTGNSIEGDTIYIENTKVKSVRGKDIEIGLDCEVDEVEYSNNLNIHPTAIVHKTIKV